MAFWIMEFSITLYFETSQLGLNLRSDFEQLPGRGFDLFDVDAVVFKHLCGLGDVFGHFGCGFRLLLTDFPAFFRIVRYPLNNLRGFLNIGIDIGGDIDQLGGLLSTGFHEATGFQNGLDDHLNRRVDFG